jgi:hypothetical protein
MPWRSLVSPAAHGKPERDLGIRSLQKGPTLRHGQVVSRPAVLAISQDATYSGGVAGTANLRATRSQANLDGPLRIGNWPVQDV